MISFSNATNIENGAVAIGTSRRKEVMIVRFAVRPAVALEEVPGAELLVAVSAGEVLRVPGAAQRGDHLHTNNDYNHCRPHLLCPVSLFT